MLLRSSSGNSVLTQNRLSKLQNQKKSLRRRRHLLHLQHQRRTPKNSPSLPNPVQIAEFPSAGLRLDSQERVQRPARLCVRMPGQMRVRPQITAVSQEGLFQHQREILPQGRIIRRQGPNLNRSGTGHVGVRKLRRDQELQRHQKQCRLRQEEQEHPLRGSQCQRHKADALHNKTNRDSSAGNLATLRFRISRNSTARITGRLIGQTTGPASLEKLEEIRLRHPIGKEGLRLRRQAISGLIMLKEAAGSASSVLRRSAAEQSGSRFSQM